jgi:hypothetical protein
MVEQGSSGGVALAFDDFGWGELSAEADATGCSETELVSRAISDYVARVESGDWSMSGQVPGFYRDAAGQRQLIDVDLTQDQLQSLRAEAERQGVSIPQLVVHAVMLKLAEG